ncbi:hypothetical protein D3C81_1823990 [compost metagenome]
MTRPVKITMIKNGVTFIVRSTAMVTTRAKLIKSVISIICLRFSRSAYVPAMDPNNELIIRFVITIIAIIFALPVVCRTHKFSAML